MRRSIHAPLACVVIALAITALPARGQDKAPARPALGAQADTNDAGVYYDLGVQLLTREPRKAADAFYWAARIAPQRADALYGQRTALLMADRTRFERYMSGDRRTIEHPKTLAIDSLLARAIAMNPFLYRKFELVMFRQFIIGLNSRSGLSNQPSALEVDYAIDRWIVEADAEAKGWAAYANGQYDMALAQYARALKSTRRKARLHTERARIFQMMGRADSALVEFGLALEELRRRDTKETVFLYDSKAMLEHSIARAHETAGNPVLAREAYGRALQEDLAFHPAHVGLALLAVTAGDTATAESEMELAVELQPQDAVIRLMYGSAMLALGRLDVAQTHLVRATELEPYFAAPHRVLALVHEARKDPGAAARSYAEFLARASRTDPARREVVDRQAALTAGDVK